MSEVRIAQVGAGYWGRNLLRNLVELTSCKLVVVCDESPEVLEYVKARYPSVAVTRKVDEAVHRDDVDAVVIATKTASHFRLARHALEHEKHVFVEKPMARSVDEAQQLVALSQSVGRHCMVGHLLLYHPAFLHVQDLIQRGELGEVFYLYSTRVNLGIVRQDENAFESLAPHDLSVAIAFMDQTPVAVSAHGQAYLQSGVADVAFATVFFDNGGLAHLHTSWLDPHKMRRVTVVGSRKMAVIDDVSSTEKVRVYDKGIAPKGYADFAGSMTVRSGDVQIPHIQMQEPLRLECQHFIECIRRQQTPRTDAQNGLAVVRLLEAAQASMQHGGVRVPVAS